MTFTDGSKIRVQGKEFTIVDLRAYKTMFKDDGSFYGSSRNMCLQAEYSEADLLEKKDWANATVLQNGETIWIDGELFHTVVTDINASNGIMFLTDATYKFTLKMMEDVKEREVLESEAQANVDAMEAHADASYDECRGY